MKTLENEMSPMNLMRFDLRNSCLSSHYYKKKLKIRYSWWWVMIFISVENCLRHTCDLLNLSRNVKKHQNHINKYVSHTLQNYCVIIEIFFASSRFYCCVMKNIVIPMLHVQVWQTREPRQWFTSIAGSDHLSKWQPMLTEISR